MSWEVFFGFSGRLDLDLNLAPIFSQLISDLSALRRWASREKLSVFEPLLGKELCDELSEKIGDLLALLEKVRRMEGE